MFTIGLITFRETFEMVLIIVPLLAYITRLGRKDLSKYIYMGSTLGLAVSVLIGSFLYVGVGGLSGASKSIFEGSMSFFLCGLILYSIIWIGRQNRTEAISIEAKYKIEPTGIGLLLLSFLSVFRECLELILFSLPLNYLGALNITISILLGVLVTVILSLAIYKSSIGLNINFVFSFITLILVYIGAMMFGEGLEIFLPQISGIKTVGMMIFGVPMLYLFLKSEIKRYTRKK